MSIAFIFPGQGSQKTGMGKALSEAFPVARAVFEEIDEALQQNLSRLMWDGPDEELTLTENAQPALMAVSLATFRVLQHEAGLDLAGKAACVAGHSLGEYSALAAAGVFSLKDAARLLKTRGRAMQAAVPVGEGAMAALLGLDMDQVRAVAEEASAAGVCEIANDNAPGQVVISGARAAVEQAMVLAKQAGARRALPLPVSAPFHCSLMAPAAEVMQEALAATDMHAPAVPLMANVSAGLVSDVDTIRQGLVQQVTATVRWTESVQAMASSGVTALYELGAGNVLTGLARRIDRDLTAMAAGTPETVEELAAAL